MGLPVTLPKDLTAIFNADGFIDDRDVMSDFDEIVEQLNLTMRTVSEIPASGLPHETVLLTGTTPRIFGFTNITGVAIDLIQNGVDDSVQSLQDSVDDLEAMVEALAAAQIGTLIEVPSENIPDGSLECDGTAVDRTLYADLFAKIGVIHGEGDGSTTFKLPDYRGYFLRGFDNGAGIDPDAATRTVSATGGATGDNVGSVQGFATQGHVHSTIYGSAADDTGTGGFLMVTKDSPSIGSKTIHNSGTGVAATGSYGTWVPANETRPKNKNVMICIKYE